MITCPVCGSAEVRLSRSKRRTDVFRWLRGRREPFRCRNCRRRFFASLSTIETKKRAVKPASRRRSKRYLSRRTKKRMIRTLIMVCVFAGAFILFLIFLRYMMTERQPKPFPGVIPGTTSLPPAPYMAPSAEDPEQTRLNQA